jgi:hypothetical protein
MCSRINNIIDSTKKNSEKMIFKGINNQTVELKIINYQYPASHDKDWDGNWLNIYIKVNSQVGNWQTVDPSLTTWEFQELIDWFQDLSNNKKQKWDEMGFTEPNLSFCLLNDYNDKIKAIRIKFDLESRPKSATNEKEYFVDIDCDKNELDIIVNDLNSELKRYPIRK